MRLLVLRKNFISQIFALCDFLAIYFITAIRLMQILAYLFHLCDFLAIFAQKIALMK